MRPSRLPSSSASHVNITTTCHDRCNGIKLAISFCYFMLKRRTDPDGRLEQFGKKQKGSKLTVSLGEGTKIEAEKIYSIEAKLA